MTGASGTFYLQTPVVQSAQRPMAQFILPVPFHLLDAAFRFSNKTPLFFKRDTRTRRPTQKQSVQKSIEFESKEYAPSHHSLSDGKDDNEELDLDELGNIINPPKRHRAGFEVDAEKKKSEQNSAPESGAFPPLLTPRKSQRQAVAKIG